MTIFTSLKENFINAMQRRGQRAAHQELMKMTDRQLDDFGISRYLLIEGISAWPWKQDSEADVALNSVRKPSPSAAAMHGVKQVPGTLQAVGGARDSAEIKKAINELSSYSDRELAELGVTRGTIEESVRYGRQNIERAGPAQRHVA